MFGLSYSLLALLVLILDIIAIASVVTGRSSTERKVMWTLVILILPVVGMLFYYVVGRTQQDVKVTT